MKNYIIFTILLLAFTIKLEAQIRTEPITATKSHLSQFGTATIEIDDAGNDGIRRPLIVAEGFDPGFEGPENEFGANDIETFIGSLEDSDSEDLRNLLTNQTEFIYGDQEYDIIYVNWDNPRDYLERNAYVLEEVIRWVNERKAAAGSTEQNVVLGQSMGGVIARYALADMETDNNPATNHDTRLYISHDAPHRGANIPIGIQYFARHMADQFIKTPLDDFSFEVGDGEASVTEINSVFNQPATKQLLDNYIAPNFALDNSISEAWEAELRSKGYPTQTRNIAISNGNHCANPQDFSYSASLFQMNGKARSGLLTDIIGAALGFVDNIAMALIFNEPALLLGILPGSSKFTLDFNAKALPSAYSTANVYSGSIKYTRKVLWVLPINVDLTNESFNNPSEVIMSLDRYPGGRFELFGSVNNINYFDDDNDFDGDGEPDITQFHADILNALLGSAYINFDIEPTFGFIPTPSALDIGGEFDIPLDDDYYYYYKYNVNNPQGFPFDPPFHSYSTSFPNTGNQNEEHISFNRLNGDWLALELDAIASNEEDFDCIYVCTPTNIWGDDTICSSETYTSSQIASQYNWTINQSGSIVNVTGNGTRNLTLTRNGSNTGLVTITLTLDGDCGIAPTTTTKEIWVGLSDPIIFGADPDPNKIYAKYDDCILYFEDQGGNQNLNPSNFEFIFDTYSDFSFSGVYGNVVPLSCNTAAPFLNLSFQARIKNDCGWGPWRYFSYFLYGYDPNYPGGWGFMVLSNPASSEVKVLIKEEESNITSNQLEQGSMAKSNTTLKDTKPKEEYSVEIANIHGRVIYKSSKRKSKTFRVDKTRWKKGVYFMKVSNSKGESQSKGFIIN